MYIKIMNNYNWKVFLIVFLFPVVSVAQYAGQYPRYEHVNDTSESGVKLCCEKLLSNEYQDKWEVYYDSLGYGGYVDESKKITIQSDFCKVYNFNRESTALVQNCEDKKYYLIDRRGGFISKGYDAYYMSPYEGVYIVGKKASGKIKQGAIDSKGEIIVPIIYDRVMSSMSECYALFTCCRSFRHSSKDQWSVFNSKGQIVIPSCNSNLSNHLASRFDEVKDGVFIDKIGHKRYIFNVNDSAYRIKGKYDFEKLHKSAYLIVYKIKGKRKLYGALDLKGSECVSCTFKTIGEVIEILDKKGIDK